eukprot:CAMPEP_0172899766 /NCGR_PEP_ID=MMETSP1075-20121228/162642_1 /TAXON_ID=2916 /ORGANISM="Ceratium fusus, Strain PA161109" /LENGTH=272 /DNA_ID=CAMNT_0013755829 /DNA_START=150 /DNA_END=968 /DNA_ORIENTATION=+
MPLQPKVHAAEVWPVAARLGNDRSAFGSDKLAEVLRRDGFIVVEPDSSELAALQLPLRSFSSEEQFRFPPPENLDGTAAIPPAFGRCFNTLYGIAVAAASTLLGTDDRLLVRDPCCPKSASGRPFQGSGGPWPYNSSFFNIFNYDHGCLNTHRDRGILTVVYGVEGQDICLGNAGSVSSDEGRGNPHKTPLVPTRLWLRTTDEWGPRRWFAPPSGSLLLWAGEELRLPGVEAIEHCVRVDPDGQYVEHSHSTPDPSAPKQGNRRSVALVLDA